jgi:hypothetical protein
MSIITPYDPDSKMYVPMRSPEGVIMPYAYSHTSQFNIDSNLADSNVGELRVRYVDHIMSDPN